MSAERIRLEGAACVSPLRQGDLSNLCGLYSVLNAIQLACWRVPPTKDQLRELLAFGMRHLIKRRLLARVVAFGMDQDVWIELGSVLVRHANELLATSLTLEPVQHPTSVPPKSSVARTLKELKRALCDGHPVLCGFGGALDHFTVLAGYSKHRLTLFDSSGHRWIEQCSIGFDARCGKRHWLYPHSTRAVVDAW